MLQVGDGAGAGFVEVADPLGCGVGVGVGAGPLDGAGLGFDELVPPVALLLVPGAGRCGALELAPAWLARGVGLCFVAAPALRSTAVGAPGFAGGR